MTAPPALSLWNSLPRAWREVDGTRPAEAVRIATTAPLAAIFALDGPHGRGRLTGVPPTLDGVALNMGYAMKHRDRSRTWREFRRAFLRADVRLPRRGSAAHDSCAEVYAATFISSHSTAY
jgi:hypothetical protein